MMVMTEFLETYGYKGWKLPIEEFIRRAPEFRGDKELASTIGKIIADLEMALEIVSGRRPPMNIEQAKEVLKNHFGKNHPEMSPYGSTVKKVTMVEDLYTDRFGVLKEDDPQKTEVDIVAVVCGNCDAEVQ